MTDTPTREEMIEAVRSAEALAEHHVRYLSNYPQLSAYLGANKQLASIRAVLREVEAGGWRDKVLAILDLHGPAHARHNLDGAIIDIDHADGLADSVCMATLRRIREQLAEIERVFSPAPPGTSDGGNDDR